MQIDTHIVATYDPTEKDAINQLEVRVYTEYRYAKKFCSQFMLRHLPDIDADVEAANFDALIDGYNNAKSDDMPLLTLWTESVLILQSEWDWEFE